MLENMTPLTVWNTARRIAAGLIDVFYHGTATMNEIEDRFGLPFPPRPEIVRKLMDINGRRRFDQTDELARWVQTWRAFN